MKTNEQIRDNTISVMTVNLRFGLADDGRNSWDIRKHVFPLLFDSYQPDFIGMQEANGFQVDFFQDLLSDYHFIGKRAPAPLHWQDNLIFFKKPWKCSRQEHFFLSDTPSIPSRFPESKWPRQCILGVFENNERVVICANTHFDFESPVQVKSAKIILERLSQFPKTYPAVITGDFNAEPGSPCYNVLISDDKNRSGFKEIFCGEYSFTQHGFTGKNTGGHIDWILYNKSLKLNAKEIIRNKYNGVHPSDHFPVCAEFEYFL